MAVKCPNCNNENGGLIGLTELRREQMECHCKVCNTSWTHYHNVPKQDHLEHLKEEIETSLGRKLGTTRNG